MDFFEHQEVAKRNSLRLLVLFGLALAGIFSALYVLATWLHVGGEHFAPTDQGSGGWINGGRLLITAGFTGLLVGGGSLLRMAQLRSGGRAVAESLDAQRLVLKPGDLAGQRLQNVVEELAIASGCAVPEIYVLEEESGINAFAAGSSQSDAVIGVTRGALEQLSRDELRGVIGHEFSHILNGDMRLNLRLVGLLYGIMCLALFGRSMLGYGRPRLVVRASRRGSEFPVLLGIGLVAVGSIGVFFGRLIQAAVSRQRELLADASAAQFTRDPEALAQALEKIGRIGSALRHPQSAQVAHMLLGAGSRSGTGRSWFATHPPIEERVARLRARPLEVRAGEVWQQIGAAMAARSVVDHGALAQQAQAADFGGPAKLAAPGLRTKPPQTSAPAGSPSSTPKKIDWRQWTPAAGRPAAAQPGLPTGTSGAGDLSDELAAVSALAGAMESESRSHAYQLLERLPPRLAQAAHNPLGARAVALGLMLGPHGPDRDQRRAALLHSGHAHLAAELGRLEQDLASLDEHLALPLFDLCLPSIKAGSARQYRELRALLFELSASDGWLDPLELALRAILVARLDPHFEGTRPPRAERRRLLDTAPSVQVVAGVFAHYASAVPSERESAFGECLSSLGLESAGPLASLLELLPSFEAALAALAEVRPLELRRLLAALLALVHRDGTTSAREAECLRAVAERCACPLSPLLTALEESEG